MARKLLLADVPGLSPDLLERAGGRAPWLDGRRRAGAARPLDGVFPALTCPLHATWTTGEPPRAHGMIANGFFDRERLEAHFWDRSCRVVRGERVWSALARRRPGAKSAVLFWQNITNARATMVLSEAAVHDSRGLHSYCFSRPPALYPELAAAIGPFSILDFWGPRAGLGASRWIAKATAAVLEREAPDLALTYLPQLDYTLQRLGPDAPEALDDLAALDELLAGLAAAAAARDTELAVISGYGIVPVDRPVWPNRALREAGLLAVRTVADREYLDPGESEAFALVDHQVAHVYCEPGAAARAAALLAALPGVERAASGDELAALGVDHPRAGEVALIAAPDAWFAYEWWADDARAPEFALTMDIHHKPGYDPLELFPGPKPPLISRDHRLVRGSHGRPPAGPRDRGLLVTGDAPGGLPAVVDSKMVYSFLLDRVG